MKILTLNTWGDYGPYQERWRCLVEELITLRPDIILFQEVASETLVYQVQKVLDAPHAAVSYEAGLAVIANQPFLSETVLKYITRSTLESHDRRALVCQISTPPAGSMLVGTTHLAWKPEDQNTRIGQTRELLQFVRDLKLPAMIGGDFNDSPQSTPIEMMISAGFQDLFAALHADKNGFTWDNQNPFIQSHGIYLPDRRIDFIFAHDDLLRTHPLQSCSVVLNRTNRNSVFPSDHYGVLATLK